MPSTDDALETYNHIPLQIDPQSKQISTLSPNKSIQEAIDSLNALHTQLKSLETPNNIPPPPVPVNPKRSAQIAKLRDAAAAASRKAQWNEAIRMWTFVLNMAAGRPGWEPMVLAREEIAGSYLQRANAHVGAQNWVEGWKDAECSIECKRGPGQGPNGEKIPGNPKAFVVGGKCLMEMGRWMEAVEWLERAIEIEGKEGEDCKELARMLLLSRKEAEKGSVTR